VIKRPAPTLHARALTWLSQREHSRAELRRKLRHWAGDPDVESEDGRPAATDEEIERLLDDLEAARQLSDGRFVETRIHARQARFGNRRIEQELRQHGVTADASASAHLRDTELQRAMAVHTRKFPNAAATAAERARQMRFLAARGFTAETIRRVMKGPDDDA